MAKRRPFPSDLSDARWELIEAVLSAWRFERRGRALDFGRPPEHDLRDIMDAILYVDRTARKPGTRGFTPIPKRGAVERTYGRLMLHRRLAHDYETLPTRSEALVNLAMTDLMARRLTGENTVSWRDPKRSTKRPIPG